jgi:flagellar motor switch protein FliM
MGKANGILSICFPSLIFESLCSKLVVQAAAVTVKSKSEPGKVTRVREALLDVPFILHSILGQTSLNIQEIISLQPGDVVRLNRQVNADIQVHLDGRAAFKAKLAVRKAKKIAFVTSRLI